MPAGLEEIDPAETGLSDELMLALEERENIEERLLHGDSYLTACLNQIEEIDRLLLSKREAILTLSPWYVRLRRGKNISKLHWWWYLDEIPSEQCSCCQAKMNVEPVRMTVHHNSISPLSGGLLVYVCPPCGASHISSLSLAGLNELAASLLSRSQVEIDIRRIV